MHSQEHNLTPFWTLLAVLALLAAFAFQGSRGLLGRTEGRYAEVGREMLETGNCLEPTLGYLPHWTKPPMTYWAIAAGMKLLGVNEWGARLANAVAFLLTVFIVASMGTTLWGKKAGLVAGLVYASSPFPVIGAFALSTDTLLTLWEALAVLCCLKARASVSRDIQYAWVSAMWLAFGLGFLAKGPPALLPLLPILIWHFQSGRPVRMVNLTGSLLFVLAGLSWYGAVIARHPELAGYFLGHEVADRMVSDAFHRNPQWYKPFIFYLPLLLFGGGPWAYYEFRAIARKNLYRPRSLWTEMRKGGAGSFLLLWALVPLSVFFVVRSRLPLYVLPLWAPVALGIARSITRDVEASRPSGRGPTMLRISTLAALTCAALVIGKGASTFPSGRSDMRALYALCRSSARDENTRVVALANGELGGLQFYLKGRLRHCAAFDPKRGMKADVADLIQEMRSQTPNQSYVLIVRRSKGKALAGLLNQESIGFRCTEGPHWWAFAVPDESRHRPTLPSSGQEAPSKDNLHEPSGKTPGRMKAERS